MPVHQITNDTGAFGESGALLGTLYIVGLNTNLNSAGTILVNSIVVYDVSSGAWAPITESIAMATTSSTQSLQVGISMDTIAANSSGRIAVDGVVNAIADSAGVTAGNTITRSTVTAGRAAATSGTVVVGNTIGVALVTQATAGGLFYARVVKM